MIEPRILALGAELRKRGLVSTASALAGLFVLLGKDFAQSAAMLRRVAQVNDENVPTIQVVARAIEEQAGKPQAPLGIALRKALRKIA